MLNSQALRLSALVAAAMSAGYLWRAALEGDVPQKVLVAAPPEIRSEVGEAPFDSLRFLRRISVGDAGAAVNPRAVASVGTAAKEPGGATTIAFVRRTTVGSHRRSGRAGKRHGKTRGSHPRPAPRPRPRPRPRPAPPPPPANPPAPPAQPPPPPSPQPPPPPPAPPAPPPPPVRKEVRPGKGKGDKNHVHTGSGWGRAKKGAREQRGGKGERQAGTENRGSSRGQGSGDEGGNGNGNGQSNGNGNGQSNGHGKGNGNGHGH